MSRQTSTDDAPRPNRQRANTTTFGSPFWRRGKPEPPVAPPPNVPTLSFDELLAELTPPRVPSLNHARALADVLITHSPRPRLTVLTPIVAALCAPDSPPALQAAGYDILASYWSNHGSFGLTTAEKLTSLSLLFNLTSPWLPDAWESRLKALSAFTSSGSDTVGVEKQLLGMLRIWIESAFNGLMPNPSPEERHARQYSVEKMVEFLLSLLRQTEFVARISEDDTNNILGLFGGLVDLSLSGLGSFPQMGDSLSPLPSGSFKAPTRHQRNASSSSSSAPGRPPQPVDLAVDLYLKYLDIRLKAIAPDHLNSIVPYLFRALAYELPLLPKLALNTGTEQSKVTDLLDKIVSGPYSASCMLILKRHLLPSSTVDAITSMRTSLGAIRTLRLSIRRALQTRMARAYISRQTSDSYMPSGAPGRLDLERDLMDRAWGKDDVAVWNINRFVPTIRKAVQAWLNPPFAEVVLEGSTTISPETILLEIAGILIDLSQCFDEVADSDEMDEEEVEAVGQILTELVQFVDIHR